MSAGQPAIISTATDIEIFTCGCLESTGKKYVYENSWLFRLTTYVHELLTPT